MPDSEKQRPGVSVKMSPATYASVKLQEADALEQKLKTTWSKKKAEALTEKFGDIIMSNALEAKNNDVVGRLWNTCFYCKVKEYRSKISRAKRHKDQQLKELKKQFGIFCEDGIEYYKYLVEHCEIMLLPDKSQSQTQDSEPEGISPSLEGVIENLFKIFIHLGDLYRYSEKFRLAEECYINAAKLGPGKGNPYNQLAVVTLTQDSNMSCNALYWYVRSILATHQAFGTTPDNLKRLFEDNMTYLNEHSRAPKPPIFTQTSEKRKGSDKKNHSDLLRAQKQVANKSFLAHFVAVLHEVIKSTKLEVDEKVIRPKMFEIMNSFESLLRASTFGDAMLCKIVLICAYAYERSKESTSISRALPRDYFLLIGAALATHLKTHLTKALDRNRINGSIRLLLPYVILCEYMRQVEESGGDLYDMFWKSFCEVANLVLQVSRRAGVAPNSYLLGGEIHVPLKEYQLLRGYRPFAFLHKNYSEGEAAYLSPEDAVDALELETSQESVRSSSGDENKTKLSRFLFICEEYAENEKIPVAFLDDRYSFVEENLQEEQGAEAFDYGADFSSPSPEASDDDDAGDVVIYTAEEQDGVEAPLVPEALIVAGASDKSTTKQAAQPLAIPRNPSVVDIEGSGTTPVAPAARTLPTEPILPPPPGFAVPTARPVTNQIPNSLPPVPTQQYPHHAVYGKVVQGRQMLPTLPPPPPGMAQPGMRPLQGVPATGINANVPFGQAWQVFAGTNMQTANPFASSTPVGFGHTKSAIPIIEDQHTTTEGTSLLDSGLIDSLFLSDTKTNNPWWQNVK